ncbi:BgTH12-04507 [Blumeria graminis f. sp. triticale]|nr:BgTH12-04507 [Blumeria graminis f. sp. triticale]
MSHKDRDGEYDERLSEKRNHVRREKTPEKLHKSRSSKTKTTNSDTAASVKTRRRKVSGESDRKILESSEPLSTIEDIVPELSRAHSRCSLPYPTFNRAYSRQSVRATGDEAELPAVKPPITPNPTDLGSGEKSKSKLEGHVKNNSKNEMPPSPPETDVSEENKDVDHQSQAQNDSGRAEKSASKISLTSQTSKRDANSRLSASSKVSDNSSCVKQSVPVSENDKDVKSRESKPAAAAENLSNTSAASLGSHSVEEKIKESPAEENSSVSTHQSSNPSHNFTVPSTKSVSSQFIQHDAPTAASKIDSSQSIPSFLPSDLAVKAPCVDYLMRNGGLARSVPKSLIAPVSKSTSQQSTRQPPLVPISVDRIFSSCFSLLEQYETVLSKNGSLAVATGYRSVARRLLDRLEVIMGRDLSTEGCKCIMCQHPDLAPAEKPKGLGWGEVLEWSAGRKELPSWPAFNLALLGVKPVDCLDLSQQYPARPGSPVKIDPDVAEELREQYLLQSKKTKLAVDRWLSSCSTTTSTPPLEVDDETLSFAILTHLDSHERPIFNALITGSTTLQTTMRVSSQSRKSRSELIMKTVQSLQRLYRLPAPPRDPEAAIFLLKNPKLHPLLATMAGISSHEWEILTSGRFDGFLWSGADSDAQTSLPPSYRGSSMSPSPGLMSRNQTPSLTGSRGNSSIGSPTTVRARRPVLNDEETEIEVVAEVEREIYLGMEALEEAFENLHRKAEHVRRGLRERGAGLTISLRSRRLAQPANINPNQDDFSGSDLSPGYERRGWSERSNILSECEWDHCDEFSELAPDDSASNISSSRHRRPKRRNERNKPARIEEENED